MEVIITNLTRKKISEKKIKKIALTTFKILSRGQKHEYEIDIVFCGDKKIRELNRKWRKKDRVTDVLSFSNVEEVKGAKRFILPQNSVINLGEIFISLPETERQATRYGETFDMVLARLFVHGIMHLMGYDHEKDELQAEKMFGLQERILRNISK